METTTRPRTCALLPRLRDPETGFLVAWYLNFLHARASLSGLLVAHHAGEVPGIVALAEGWLAADEAVRAGFVCRVYVVWSRRAYPRSVKSARLVLSGGLTHVSFKRLLGNRAYDEVHRLYRRIGDYERDIRTPRAVVVKTNTFHGRTVRAGGAPHAEDRGVPPPHRRR